MDNKPKQNKLKLVSDKPNLKTYYVPFTKITVELYPVKANTEEYAIYRANKGDYESIAKKITLEENFTNDVYLTPDVNTTELFSRQIDHFKLDIKDFDYPIPSSKS
tara:strand:+ start:2668 stop:2985 length:318 start_codon:yes stop_codon:yes gene_type:complete